MLTAVISGELQKNARQEKNTASSCLDKWHSLILQLSRLAEGECIVGGGGCLFANTD